MASVRSASNDVADTVVRVRLVGNAAVELRRATDAVIVWDASTGKMLTTWKPGGELSAIAFSPDGDRLMAGTNEAVRSYSTEDWSLLAERSWRNEPGIAPSTTMVFTSDGSKLVAAASDRQGATDVLVLDPVSLDTISRIEQTHDGGIRTLDVSDDDTRVATVGTDGFARVWDLESRQLLHEIPIAAEAVVNVQFIDGDSKLITTTQRATHVVVVSLSAEDQLRAARDRVTRTFTPTECVTYKIDPCPSLEELRSG